MYAGNNTSDSGRWGPDETCRGNQHSHKDIVTRVVLMFGGCLRETFVNLPFNQSGMKRGCGGPRGGAAHLFVDADEGGVRAAVVAAQLGRELLHGQPPVQGLALSAYLVRYP